jgi:predicted N-formylglutamate amidohydrolase
MTRVGQKNSLRAVRALGGFARGDRRQLVLLEAADIELGPGNTDLLSRSVAQRCRRRADPLHTAVQRFMAHDLIAFRLTESERFFSALCRYRSVVRGP